MNGHKEENLEFQYYLNQKIFCSSYYV